MMTDDQIIEVVRAHRDGKIIQWCNADKNDWADYQVCCFKDSGLNFDFIHYDYRIKPESKFRPYANAEEFLRAQKEHGPYFKYKEGNKNWFPPDIIDDEGCHIGVSKWKDNHESSVSYYWICDKFKWQDGTPCGILKEN